MSDEEIQVVIPPALRKPLEEWLHRRNLELVRIPAELDTDLPTYIIGLA